MSHHHFFLDLLKKARAFPLLLFNFQAGEKRVATELNSYELNGVKQSIADWISNLGVGELVAQAMIGKEPATRSKVEWQTDSIEPTDDDNALMEGFDFDTLDDTFEASVPMTVYTQKMGKAVKVTGDSDAQAAWGRGKESDYQAEKKAIALKTDFEKTILSNQATAQEVKGVSPRRLGGMLSQMSSVDGGVTRTGDPRNGVVTVIESAAALPTEDDIWAAMKALRQAGGKGELLLAHDNLADVISNMQESTPNRARIFENTPEFSKEVTTITDAYGMTLKVVFSEYMPLNTAYIFTPDNWKIIVFREPQTKVQDASGDYKRSVLHFDMGLRHRNPWASAAVIPKQTTP